MPERICRYCQWVRPFKRCGERGLVCENPNSEHDGLEVRREDTCEEWEE